VGDDEHWAERFPALFGETYVAYADCRVRGTTRTPPDHLVTRLHVVGVTPAATVLVCRSDHEWRFLPGGTREPGEALRDLVARELMEEAGAVLNGEPALFFSHMAVSGRAEPYRPHLPHPRAYWSYAVAGVRVLGPPTNPPDGETIVDVLAMEPGDAADYIDRHDPVHGDVVRLADAMDLIRRGAQQR
jgi:8-oxo-dGTP diphosphatase